MSQVSFIKMSAKLIIHKFEEDNNFQTLYITIEEKDKDSSANFSVWQDGKTELKKKVNDKPRLVVKMVSDDNINHLNLDCCSKEVDYKDNYVNEILDNTIKNNLNENCNFINSDVSILDCKNMYNQYYETINKQSKVNDNTKTEYKIQQSYTRQFQCDNKNEVIDPLECCLEKVKKNNALIMENIHMLNRTLDYTKKKEILDMINPKPLRSYPCNACGKCFVYETGLRRHYSVRHANLDTQPRWQLVWTCTECFQVWPRQDLAVRHATQCNSNNTDCVQEIKTSSLLQCEFCEKVFTCIPRLLRHAKMHSVTNNYECNACDIAFSCYKTAEQHWQSCLWLKMCYQFSLPKLLLCNACDRKFRNYDQLYNHRYKVGHYISKTTDECNGIYTSTLVYQCEVCGQWFNTISQLQFHRGQYHPQFDTGISYNTGILTATEAL